MQQLEQFQSNLKNELLSDFNEAQFQIYRLHLAWLKSTNYALEGKLIQWKWVLDSIWRELSPDAIKKDRNLKEQDRYIVRLSKINNSIAEAEKAKIPTLIYNKLQEKEVFLRCLQDDVGKGSKRSLSDEDDFDD